MCLSEATHTKHGFSFPSLLHLLQKGLSIGPIMYRYLLSMVCPVRRPVTALVCVLLKGNRLVLRVRIGPKINFQACLWVLIRPLPHCHMLVVHPAFYLFSYILPRNSQGQFMSNKLADSSISCGLVSNFISTYPRMARDPKQSHRMLGENVVQSLLALLYQWGCYFGSLKGFQSPLTVRENTNIFLWSNVHMTPPKV